jgi:hypothetical protein
VGGDVDKMMGEKAAVYPSDSAAARMPATTSCIRCFTSAAADDPATPHRTAPPAPIRNPPATDPCRRGVWGMHVQRTQRKVECVWCDWI